MANVIFNDILNHLLNDQKPSIYLNSIKESLKGTVFNELYMLTYVEQSKEFHPEGVVWNHVMMVLDMAAKVKKYTENKEEFMIAALMHDIGKNKATKINKNGKITAYNHDTIGAEETRKILEECGIDTIKINNIVKLVEFHMHHLYIINKLPFGNVKKMIKEVELKDIILLFLCDRLGRGLSDEQIFNQQIEQVRKILSILNQQFEVEIIEIEEIINKI